MVSPSLKLHYPFTARHGVAATKLVSGPDSVAVSGVAPTEREVGLPHQIW